MGETGTFIFYISVITLSAFLSKCAYRKKNYKYKNTIVFCVVLLLAIVAGIRYEVGSDWFQYYMAPEWFDIDGIRGGTKGDYEIGYKAIAYIIRSLGLGGSVFLFVYAFITYYFLFKVIDKFADRINVFTAVFMYGCLYYLVSFNITRQALSISVAMYAITQLKVTTIKEDGSKETLLGLFKQNMRFVIYTFIAFLFHKGGIIVFIALPVCYFMRKRNAIRLGMLLVLVLGIINFRMFTGLAIQIMGSTDFQWYFIANKGGDGSWLKFVLRYLPFLFGIWLSYKSLIKDQKMYDMYNLALLGIIINSLSLVIATDIERIGYPFLYFLVIVTGFAMKSSNCNRIVPLIKIRVPLVLYKMYRIFLYLFMLWTMWYIFFLQGSYQVVPYQTIFGR